MKVLDLGCGAGLTPEKLSLPTSWEFIGLDDNYAAVCKAHLNFPHRAFVCAAGEALPFPAASFGRVIANVALPYMDIAKALAETHSRPGSWRYPARQPASLGLHGRGVSQGSAATKAGTLPTYCPRQRDRIPCCWAQLRRGVSNGARNQNCPSARRLCRCLVPARFEALVRGSD